MLDRPGFIEFSMAMLRSLEPGTLPVLVLGIDENQLLECAEECEQYYNQVGKNSCVAELSMRICQTLEQQSCDMKLLPCSFAVFIFAAVGAGNTARPAQDLASEGVRFEEEFHETLRLGDFDRLTQLLPQAERLESQLLQILEDPQSSAHQREGLQPLLDMMHGLRADAARLAADRDWRRRSRPRIERPPDPNLISISAEEDGQTIITGNPGAAGDTRARIVRVVNLFTSDQVAATHFDELPRHWQQGQEIRLQFRGCWSC